MASVDIGEKLREARLQRNLSLDELQQITKIQKRYLEAIENNQFELMPGTFYVRAFIRQYASAVKLNGDELVALYDGKHNPPAVEDVIAFEPLDESRAQKVEEEENQWMKSLPAIIFSLFGLAIAVVVLYITWQDRQQTPVIQSPSSSIFIEDSTKSSEHTTEESDTTTSETDTAEETTTSTTEEKTAQISFVSEINGIVNMTADQASAPVTLTFSAKNAPCWVGVYLANETNGDNGFFHQETVPAGQSVSVELPPNTPQAVITFGASENIRLAVNGQPAEFNPNNTGIGRREIRLAIQYAASENSASSVSTADGQ